MTTCKVKRWDLVETDIKTLCQGIEDFCNLQEVRAVQTFTLGRNIVVVAIFKTDKDKEV